MSGEFTPIVRPFRDSDYEILPIIQNEVFPDLPAAVADYTEMDMRRPGYCKFSRWMAMIDQQFAGTGYYTQYPEKYEAGKYFIWVIVRPQFQRCGLGTRIYNTVRKSLANVKPKLLQSQTREDQEGALIVASKLGFTEYFRGGESHLDLDRCDVEPYSHLDKELKEMKIEIKTLNELLPDPERNRKLWLLDWEVTRDEPGSLDDTRLPLEEFINNGLLGPHRVPEGYFVAVHESEYIGVCMLNKNHSDSSLWHGITGVRRDWRNKGIATALKVRAIQYAKSVGCPVIKTGNAVNNAPMLAINQKLGFVRQFDWINLEKAI